MTEHVFVVEETVDPSEPFEVGGVYRHDEGALAHLTAWGLDFVGEGEFEIHIDKAKDADHPLGPHATLGGALVDRHGVVYARFAIEEVR